MGVQENLVQWMKNRLGKYRYSQGSSRLTPDSQGYTDCSALVRYCYKQVVGTEVGTWTGDQQRYGKSVFGPTMRDYNRAIALLQPGDLVFFDWDGKGIQNYDHVAMYMGNGQTIGHGGPGYGPVVKQLRNQWNASKAVGARRYVDSQTQKPRLTTLPDLPSWSLPQGHYYGDIDGPDESHGGYYPADQAVITIIQQRLIAKGYVSGISDFNDAWADGIYGPSTTEAVTRFQQKEVSYTTDFGSVYSDDYAILARNAAESNVSKMAEIAAGAPNLPMPFQLQGNHFYGDISGPNESHGGWYPTDKVIVKIIQQRLIAKGYATGVTDIDSGWADGIWGPATTEACIKFQQKELPGTLHWGRIYSNDYETLAK